MYEYSLPGFSMIKKRVADPGEDAGLDILRASSVVDEPTDSAPHNHCTAEGLLVIVKSYASLVC